MIRRSSSHQTKGVEMRSKAVLAFRAVVMLSVLILIPLAAMSGPRLLELLRRILPLGPPSVGPSVEAAASSAVRSEQHDSRAPVDGWSGMGAQPPPIRQRGDGPSSRGGPEWGVVCEGSRRGIRDVCVPPSVASVGPTDGFAPGPPPQRLPAVPPTDGVAPGVRRPAAVGSSPTLPVDSSVVRASHTTPVARASGPRAEQDQSTLGRGAGSQRAPTAPESPSDRRFVAVQRRLRELGATYYVLETWGDEGRLFRFYCRMAVGGNPACNRYFEATDSVALQAMEKVLAEVESWRAARP